MTLKKGVKVQLGDGTIIDGSLEVIEQASWKLVLTGLNDTFEGSGEDCFSALVSLRENLDQIGVRLLCMGARLDVYPSGMSRNMGGARKAYINKLGAPALNSDLVDIFDYTTPETVGSVVDQTTFHKKWMESLRQRLSQNSGNQ